MQRLAKSLHHPHRWLVVLCAVAIGFGVVVRCSHLERSFFWLDETFTALRVSGQTLTSLRTAFQDGQPQPIAALEPYQTVQFDRPVWDSARSLQRDGEAQQPLYYVLLNLWMRAWAIATHFTDFAQATENVTRYVKSDSMIGAMRSFSVFCSLLTLPALYRLATRLWRSPRAGWLAAALMSVSPIFVVYAQEARPYALWVLTIVVMSDCLLAALQHDRWRFWGLYSLSLTASFYVFVNTLFIVLAQGVAILTYWYGQRRSSQISLEQDGQSSLSPSPSPSPANPQRLAQRWLLTTLTSAVSLGLWFAPMLPMWSTVTAQVSWLEMPIAPIALLAGWIGNSSRLWLDVGLNGTQFLEAWALLPNLLCVALTVLPLVWGVRQILRGLRQGAIEDRNQLQHLTIYVALLSVVLIPVLAVTLPDLIWGGLRSTVIRYVLPSFAAIQLLWVGWFVATPRFDLRRWVVLMLMLSLGMLSSLTYLSTEIWWNKQPTRSYATLTAATLINDAPEPIVLSDQFQVMPLVYHLENSVKILLAVPGQPLAVDAKASLFLFRPSAEFLGEFQQLAIVSLNSNQPLVLVEKVPETLWQLQKQ